jgi:hypothetical protein
MRWSRTPPADGRDDEEALAGNSPSRYESASVKLRRTGITLVHWTLQRRKTL